MKEFFIMLFIFMVVKWYGDHQFEEGLRIGRQQGKI